jgi:GNAT superfamily N-acetyltransferase
MNRTLDSTVRLLTSADAPEVTGLTFPSYRYLLALADAPEVVAVAAFCDGRPVGLALGGQPPGGGPAELGSLFVERAYRGQGLGGALLAAAEEELARRGARQLRLEYHTAMPARGPLEKLLLRRHWSEPQAVMLRCQADDRTTQAPVFNAPLFPRLQRQLADVQVFPWAELTSAERESLLAQQRAPGSWIPPSLSPFQEDRTYARSVCLGLRADGEVVGWLITHRLAPTVARYTWGYVRPDLARRGAYILLMREVAWMHREECARGLQVLWTVPLWAAEMAHFVRRRLGPWLCSLAEVRESYKAVCWSRN